MKVVLMNGKKKMFITSIIKQIEELQEKAVLKIYTKMLLEDVINNVIKLYVVVDNYKVLGYCIVSGKTDKGCIEILEVFEEGKGLGSMLLYSLKEKYDVIEAEALNGVVDFYTKNGFKIKKIYWTRTDVVWSRD